MSDEGPPSSPSCFTCRIPSTALVQTCQERFGRAFGNDKISLRNSSFRSPRTEFHVVLRCMYHRPICLMKPFGSVVSPPLFLGIFSFVEEGGWPRESPIALLSHRPPVGLAASSGISSAVQDAYESWGRAGPESCQIR